MKRILVVDDDVRVCEVLAEFLQRDGYEVAVAHHGRAALGELRAGPVDLLILDINMPELGGASLVQKLRSDPEWARFAALPIIVVSALWDVVTFDLDVQAGFAKPLKYEELKPKILELIGPP
ncbi:MAG TPA: response regulator [Methylomirabilota bacterium]|jgi:CheY-like chemotaxis protein|nr:response regulator [Methylomirabilota bacterium]